LCASRIPASILFTVVIREPATAQQKAELSGKLARLKDTCTETLALVSTMYGPEDHRTIRAGELCDSLQRLIWDLDRK
jgi:hypothetical protein